MSRNAVIRRRQPGGYAVNTEIHLCKKLGAVYELTENVEVG